MKSVVEQIINYGITQPDKMAISDGKKNLTFYDLISNAFYAKKVLIENYRVKKGEYIIIAADKQTEFVPLYLACHMVGAITLPIAPDINPNRYQLIKDKVKPVLVVGFEDESSQIASFKSFSGMGELEDVAIKMEDVADVMFTTGTTGEPKGVQLTHRNIAAAARNINTFIGNSPDDIEMIALPISHSFGIGRMRCALSNGQTVILLGSFANVKRFFRFMREYRVNGFGMVPASWALLKKLSGMEISEFKNQLNYIEIGSAPMPIEEKELLADALPDTRICMHYGLTEASRSTFMEFHKDRDMLNSIGKQSPNMFITVRDNEGNVLPNDSDGELCVQGDAVTKGYLFKSKEDYFWGDSFRTGDWGFIDKEGYITLKSRKKELINVGGKKVSPAEVEEVLCKITNIKDCACVAIPDPKGILGEVVKAYVVTDMPDEISFDVIDPLIGRKLENYKHPVEYEIVNEIPKTSSGKVQRLMLK